MSIWGLFFVAVMALIFCGCFTLSREQETNDFIVIGLLCAPAAGYFAGTATSIFHQYFS